MAQIKAITGADYVFNGSLFDWGNYLPCCDVRIGGKALNDDQWSYYGYGWNNNELPRVMNSNEMFTVDNYISCLWAIHNGEKQKLEYPSDMGGSRGRTAFGFKLNGEMVIVCTDDAAPITIEQAQDKLMANGCVNGIVLDGGGSSQIDTPDEDITSARIVSNFVCVWVDKTPQKEDGKKMKVCLDPGHGTGEMNQSPDGSYIEHEFALDMAKRIRVHLERCGVEVKLTREDSSTPSLTARAATANTFKADLLVSLHSNATGGKGWNDTAHGLSVWTYAGGGERDKSANALLVQMAAYGVETFGSKLYHSKFTVLAKSNMPAYLIEYAFHTCHNDVILLKSDSHRAKLSIATAKAICAYGGVKWADEQPQTDDSIFRVMVGAFTVKSNAETLQAELKQKGYSAIITEVKA